MSKYTIEQLRSMLQKAEREQIEANNKEYYNSITEKYIVTQDIYTDKSVDSIYNLVEYYVDCLTKEEFINRCSQATPFLKQGDYIWYHNNSFFKKSNNLEIFWVIDKTPEELKDFIVAVEPNID